VEQLYPVICRSIRKQVEAGLRFRAGWGMLAFMLILTGMPDSAEGSNIIELVGEQAEAFDEQMDADRDWFESSLDAFYFRPEIEGEFDEYLITGQNVPFVQALVKTKEGDKTLPLGWVCVVDIGRYMKLSVEPTGFRCRIRTSPPINDEIRSLMLQGVSDYIDKQPHFESLAAITVIRKKGVDDRKVFRKSKGKPRGKGFA